ncbi:MAG: nicotinate phosphoribosyltransferase [Actinomycetota bacterium]|nr:nicotinate phosphoribosyltransferase [Actinomycetota bacterium]
MSKDMARALITDLYELNMAASYLRRGMTARATFSLTVRGLPPDRGFLVAAGIDDCVDYLETFRFEGEDLDWLARHGFSADAIEAFRDIRFTGDVEAVDEGRIVLPQEPLLEVTAPLPEAQLVETFLLNQITYQTAIATKAVRCKLAAGPIDLVDFALRRTHGVEAGMAVARISAMAGFVATSNVEAARALELMPSGTMAHSYIEAFPSEAAAFRAFTEDLPPPYTFLVDTYDTLEGVETAARVIEDLGLTEKVAIRLDSGDLATLARQARAMLDGRGLSHVGIFVSGSLDEYQLEDFARSKAPIDAAGVGTRLGTAADAPFVDSVYKLVDVDGRPVMKLSPAKETLPGAKQVWRARGRADVLARREEAGPDGASPLLQPAIRDGRRIRARSEISEARAQLDTDLAWLPDGAKRIRKPEPAGPLVSDALQELAHVTRVAAENTAASEMLAGQDMAGGTRQET